MAKKPTIANHTIYLDGTFYTGTRFENCEMIYSGGPLPALVNNEYVDCRWRLEGPASQTLDFMRFLVSIGGKDLVLSSLGVTELGALSGF